MSWVSYYFSHLNCTTYFRHVPKIKHYLCLRAFSVRFLAFVWSLNCKSLVCKFYISFSTILFFVQCWYWRSFSSVILSKVNLNSCSFFRCFFLTCKFYLSGLYIVPYFWHGKYSIWGFFVLTFIKKCKLTTIYFLKWFFMIWKWHNSDP